MEEFTTTLQVRPVSDIDCIDVGSLVVLAGTLRRVTQVGFGQITLTNEDGNSDTFDWDFFGGTWKVAVL